MAGVRETLYGTAEFPQKTPASYRILFGFSVGECVEAGSLYCSTGCSLPWPPSDDPGTKVSSKLVVVLSRPFPIPHPPDLSDDTVSNCFHYDRGKRNQCQAERQTTEFPPREVFALLLRQKSVPTRLDLNKYIEVW